MHLNRGWGGGRSLPALSFSQKFDILVSCFCLPDRIKGRGPQKEQKEGDGYDG
jgi:hypothetical protein